MSNDVRNVFILAGFLAAYGTMLWLYETKAFGSWIESFVLDPKAQFARQTRDDLIREEFAEETADAADGNADA